MENIFSLQNNNQKENNQPFQNNQNNQNSIQNKNIPINKDSYLFLHSKKFLNKIPNNDNNQPLIDFTEPQPEIYNNLNLNNKKINDNKISSLSNQTKNKKLLEEYFKLKNNNNINNNTNNTNNTNNYPSSNYYTYNNNIYNPNTNINLKNKENQYKPLIKRQKQKKQNNPKVIKYNKKSKSLKGANSLSRIYQPEKNMNNSPSFTPIKTTIPKEKKESIKHSPYFGSKLNSNSNKDIKIPLNSNINDQKKITYSEESEAHIKSILKNKNMFRFQEKKNFGGGGGVFFKYQPDIDQLQ